MVRKNKKYYHITAIFDTETTNIKKYDSNGKVKQNETTAICILYIFNDVRLIDLKNYTPEKDDKISLIRYEKDALKYIDDLIEWGERSNLIPVVCAYNLMFDMQTLMYDLNRKYKMNVNAQSSTNVYTLDLMKDGKVALRFWDTYHLEMRGLAAMGETCGLGKAIGEWNYDLIRTCETPLTDEEEYYARRDVQVIPAYLKYLLDSNEWLRAYDFGHRVITKTSLVRQMAQRQIGRMEVTKRNGKKLKLLYAFENLCKQQLPRNFKQYAIRKACFRGGWTFTAGSYASRVIENVASIDVTSMHHAFINGRYIPIDFAFDNQETMDLAVKHVLSKSVEDVLAKYHKPFACAFHYRIEFENLRLKQGTCFEKWQVALIPTGKFRTVIPRGAEFGNDERAQLAELSVREKGFHDAVYNPLFAYGKLYKCDWCALYLSELELWIIEQMYDYDSIKPTEGESTVKWKIPPDYVTLQSNTLFETKNAAKKINKNYQQGKPYELEIPESIPVGIANGLKTGTISEQFFAAYYNSTVKGMFNGIYGTMAQDVFKPDYTVLDGEICIDSQTRLDESNFVDRAPKKCKVLYTYGLRIVGGSRMHLCIAMILLYRKFGDDIAVTGGDTDSLKIHMERDIKPEEIMNALEPLHDAIRKAIETTQFRLRNTFPKYASNLDEIGEFDYETCDGYDSYKYHMECWNKARVSISYEGKIHVTCAGLSRPENEYHIEHFISDLIQDGYSPEEILPNILGYNVYVTHDVCHALEHKKPNANDFCDEFVKDYLGNETHVFQPMAIALYESGRMLGDTNKRTNAENVRYLKERGLYISDNEKWLEIRKVGNKIYPLVTNEEGILYGHEKQI